jgi:hypothetical protein
VHHPVREPHLVDEVGCTVDGLFGGIFDIVESVKDILDDPVVTVQGKGALEHDGRPAHQAAPERFVTLVPEIDILCGHGTAAMRAWLPGCAPDIEVRTPAADGGVVDDPAARRRLFHTPHEVHENRLSCAAPANNSQDLAFGNLKRDILEHPISVKIHAEVLDRDQWSLHNTLYLM